jgi:hypothetical protein
MKLQSAEFWIFTCHGYPNFGFILDGGWTKIFETSSLLCLSDHHTVTHFTTTSFVKMNLCFVSMPLWKLISSTWISYSVSLMTSVPQATYKVMWLSIQPALELICVGCKVQKYTNFICFENKGVFVWKALTATCPLYISLKYRFILSECPMV